VNAQTVGYTRRAGLGPWTQVADQAQRLQILSRMGEHRQVLAEAGGLRARMDQLPALRGDGEAFYPWNVRETILNTASVSALALREWQQGLELNAAVVASKRQRGTGDQEIARYLLGDTGPLIELGQTAEAVRILGDCQRVFERYGDLTQLALVLSTRASLEGRLGHPETAAELERNALRLTYAQHDPRDITISHHSLAGHLRASGADPAGQRALLLAAALSTGSPA
jgi:hypothetical protein